MCAAQFTTAMRQFVHPQKASRFSACPAYSAPIKAEDAYYIVKLVETIPAGVRERASIEEDFRASLRNSADVDAAWDERLNAWIEEAKAAAVFHRETYEMLPDQYLSYSAY